MKLLSAGSEIDSWCTKCRLDLMHRIVAMVAGAPKRVVCLTCNSEHNYRAPRAASAKPSVKVRSKGATTKAEPRAGSAAHKAVSKARAEQDRSQDWATKTLGQAATAFTRYSMDRSFKPGELVMHSKFGEGFVERLIEGGKVSVMFRDGPKVLMHRSA